MPVNAESSAPEGAGTLWFYEYLDHIAGTELKARSPLQGATRIRYDVARRQQGNTPLSKRAADCILAALKPGSVIFLSTGAGNPVFLPKGETDGPSGIAVLGAFFTNLNHRVCVLSEANFLPGIMAAFVAAGVPVLEERNWRQRPVGALALEFPLGRAAGDAFVAELLPRVPEAAVAIFLEKPGPNIEGVFHNSSGKPKPADDIAHLNRLAELGRARHIITGGIGDGGNEIGFGLIREELSALHPYGQACGCPCGRGIIDATAVDFLFPAAVSNWGGYALAAAMAIALRRPDLMPSADVVEASIRAPILHGAVDGYSGLARPTVDGTSLQANLAAYAMMEDVIRLALKA